MEHFSIRSNFKNAAVGWDQLQGADALLQLHEPFRQTDGMGLIVSSCAIFDDNFLWHIVVLGENRQNCKRLAS
tara:strand:- start:379 stop:597 length:219 start_codon:yes stop_codon:yes gene_type:complete